MKFSKGKIGDSILSSANISQLHLVEEPEMYVSSSGESKYSEEDKHYRDHLLQNFDALENSIKKFKNAEYIHKNGVYVGLHSKVTKTQIDKLVDFLNSLTH